MSSFANEAQFENAKPFLWLVLHWTIFMEGRHVVKTHLFDKKKKLSKKIHKKTSETKYETKTAE